MGVGGRHLCRRFWVLSGDKSLSLALIGARRGRTEGQASDASPVTMFDNVISWNTKLHNDHRQRHRIQLRPTLPNARERHRKGGDTRIPRHEGRPLVETEHFPWGTDLIPANSAEEHPSKFTAWTPSPERSSPDAEILHRFRRRGSNNAPALGAPVI